MEKRKFRSIVDKKFQKGLEVKKNEIYDLDFLKSSQIGNSTIIKHFREMGKEKIIEKTIFKSKGNKTITFQKIYWKDE